MGITVLIWALAATVLAGSFIVVSLISPVGAMLGLGASGTIIAAALAGAIVAIPLAIVVAKAVLSFKRAV